MRVTARGHGIDRMTVSGIERKAHILGDTASLRAVLFGAADHRALDGDDRNAALTARRVPAALINRPRRLGFIYPGVRIA